LIEEIEYFIGALYVSSYCQLSLLLVKMLQLSSLNISLNNHWLKAVTLSLASSSESMTTMLKS